MILFFNVFVTNKALTIYDRGILGQAKDRVDVFKYSLASFSVLSWSHVIIYCELDTDYAARRDELEKFVYELYPRAHLFFHRSTKQVHWRKTLEHLFTFEGDDLVWYNCNDDHIFIDYEPDLVQSIEQRARELPKTHEFISIYTSHWPELLFFLDPDASAPYCPGHPPLVSNIIEETDRWFINEWYNFDSLLAVNKNLLKYWWLDHDYGDAFMPRADFAPFVKSPKNIACIIPKREIVRHYDGYTHVSVDLNVCPPLTIPPGFFNNEIRIQYCGTAPKPGWVHINPLLETYKTADRNGVDSRCVLEDVPLFWRNRVAEVNTIQEIDPMALVLKRNESVLRIASSKLKRYSWKELAQRLPLAMRTYQGQTPIPEERSNFSKPEFTSNLKHNRSSAKPEISVVLLETSNCGYGTYVLDMLVSQQTLNRQLFEVVWIGANPTIPMALCSKTDVALHQKQHHYWENGCVNKCRALNSGAIHSGSEIVVLVESDFLIGPDFLSNVYEQRDNIRNSGCFVSTIARAAGKESGPSIAYSLAVSKQWFLKLHGLDEDDRFLMDSNGSTAEFLTRFLKAGGQLLHKPDFMGVLPFPQPQTPGLLIKSVQCTSSNQIPDNQAFPKVHSTDLLEFLEKVE